MKTLQIDEKWAVEYDPDNNDRPERVLRYGEVVTGGSSDWKNDTVAMFYALLRYAAEVDRLEREREWFKREAASHFAESCKLADRAESAERELEKANNEFGSQTAGWPDLWKRIADLKELSNSRWHHAEAAEARIAELEGSLEYYANIQGMWGDKARAALKESESHD